MGDEVSFGDGGALQLESVARNGERYGPGEVWAVELAGALYLRTTASPSSPWYRHARATGRARLRVGQVAHWVDLQPVAYDDSTHASIGRAYATAPQIPASLLARLTGPTSRYGTLVARWPDGSRTDDAATPVA